MPADDTALAVPECVPARMVNEFVYCPRLAYIEWVQSDFAPNFETVDGQYRHRAVEGRKDVCQKKPRRARLFMPVQCGCLHRPRT